MRINSRQRGRISGGEFGCVLIVFTILSIFLALIKVRSDIREAIAKQQEQQQQEPQNEDGRRLPKGEAGVKSRPR